MGFCFKRGYTAVCPFLYADGHDLLLFYPMRNTNTIRGKVYELVKHTVYRRKRQHAVVGHHARDPHHARHRRGHHLCRGGGCQCRAQEPRGQALNAVPVDRAGADVRRAVHRHRVCAIVPALLPDAAGRLHHTRGHAAHRDVRLRLRHAQGAHRGAGLRPAAAASGRLRGALGAAHHGLHPGVSAAGAGRAVQKEHAAGCGHRRARAAGILHPLGRHLLCRVRGRPERMAVLCDLQRHVHPAGHGHLLRDRADPRHPQGRGSV